MTSINQLIANCRQQTLLYSRRQTYDPSACFELWRRAIVDHDEPAWSALVEQYSPSVKAWIQQRLGSSAKAFYDEDALLNGVFINLYRFLSPVKFASFNSLASVMQYLKLCCGSVVADAQRDIQARKLNTSLEVAGISSSNGDSPEGGFNILERLSDGIILEEQVLNRVDRSGFWQEIWDRLDDSVDRTLVYLRYVLEMPPREIAETYPHLFPDVKEVYRRNKNLLWRLRNKPV